LAHDRFVRPTWTDTDPLAPLFSMIFGSYPDPGVITIDYVRGTRSVLEFPDRAIDASEPLAPELQEFVTPLLLTGLDLTVQRDRSGWLAPGIVLGDLASFDDLLLFWNLRAAGAQLCFCDPANSQRLRPFLDAFLAALRRRPAEVSNRVNFWSRSPDWPPPRRWTIDLDVTGLRPNLCRGEGDDLWNGCNIRTVRPKFSAWHRDVVSSYRDRRSGERRLCAARPAL
jgi:hypothetical protein